ncbi:hypothetical protein CRYUN_Cryun21dG0082300 [Craigia yunnanensis]
MVNDNVIERRSKLKIGWRKINCDGALDLKTKVVGAGVIVRDYKGVVVDGKCRRRMVDSLLMVETLALRKGIGFAIQRKWQNVVLEIDSKELQYVLTKNCKMID